jgi:uncharacterized protein
MTTVCILSDTHENIPIIKNALPLIKQRAPNVVIHCGDIISPPTLKLFEGLPMRFVLGNNDGEIEGLKEMCRKLGFPEIATELEEEIGEKRFYVTHGTREYIIDEQAGSQLYDYVLHGHTHEIRNETMGRTRIINPGALFMAKQYTFAVLNPETDVVEFIEVPREI